MVELMVHKLLMVVGRVIWPFVSLA